MLIKLRNSELYGQMIKEYRKIKNVLRRRTKK
jgi:hypothetical protein